MRRFPLSKISTTIFILTISALLFSCYPGGAFDEEDFDVAVTLYNDAVNFNQIKTYAIPDTVMEVGMGNVALAGQHDKLIIELIRANMSSLGYTEVTEIGQTPPDVILFAYKTSSTNVEVYNTYPYWWDSWGYYGWWPIYGGIGPGYSPYYPWGGTTVYSYTTGTLFIEMLDPSIQNMPNRIPALWAGAINGILDGNFQQTQNRITEQVNRLFDQSPYLKTQ